MTLITGLRCRDGLLLASDREESGGERKDSVEKIYEFHNSQCILAIAGAGHAALCDYAIEEMRRAASQSKENFVGNHVKVLSNALLAVHADYIWESRSDEDRRIAFIVGIHDLTKDEQYLYLTDEEILHPKPDYACSGTGEIIGGYFLERLYEQSLSVFEAHTLLAFILKEAKDSIGGVGRETELVILSKEMNMLNRSWHSRSADRELPHLSQCMTKFWKNKN